MPFKKKAMIKKLDTVGKGKDFSKKIKKPSIADLMKKNKKKGK